MLSSLRDSQRRTWARYLPSATALLFCVVFSGCAALGNPVANGVPVRRLSPELLGESRSELTLIPLTALRRQPPDIYRLDAGDVLGIWIEGVLGEKGVSPFSPIDGRINFAVPV